MASNNIWSTIRIGELTKEYQKTGVLPKINPFYMGDIRKRKPRLNFEYTKDEVKEMAICNANILHFSETHCNVLTDEGVKKIKMRWYQKRILQQYKYYRFNVVLSSRQSGKSIDGKSVITINESDVEIQRVYYARKYKKIPNIIKFKLFLYDKLSQNF